MLNKEDTLTIAVVDDHRLFREGLCRIIHAFEGMEVIFHAAGGNPLLKFLESNSDLPDLVISDLKMEDLDGYQTTQAIKAKYPQIGVIVVSMYDSPENIIELVSAGADSYLNKKISSEDLHRAILTVSSGEKYFTKRVSKVLASHVSNQVSRSRDYSLSPEFKPLEIEVLQLICQEKTNKGISEELKISERSIENIRKQLYRKTGTRSSTGLVIYAISYGLFSLYQKF
ncbi:response regulator transcription factor [bacterium SCSIO 12741]|nr:response regulator transcription factor [bacterium SCSIO 12741]